MDQTEFKWRLLGNQTHVMFFVYCIILQQKAMGSDMLANNVSEGSYVFGPFVFLPDRHALLRGKEEVRLGSRAGNILHLLVSRAGELITKEELIAHTWPTTYVEESNLKVHISALRRALGETGSNADYIATVAGRGYRFLAQVLITSARGTCEALTKSTVVNLSEEPTLFGRDREVQDLIRSLASERVVTLAGPVGVGKASIARTAAATVVTGFDAGYCIIDFSMMGNLREVSNFIAETLGLRGKPTDMTTPLLEYLDHRRMLIILDHCEHAAVALRLFVSRFVASSCQSSILVIGLEPLQVPYEKVHRIGLLSYPAQAESGKLSTKAALAFPAVTMIVERVRELNGYELTNDDLKPVISLCQIMDGRPRSITSALSNLYPQFSFVDMLDIVTRRVLYGPQPGEPDDPQCLMSGTTDFGYGRLSSDESALFKLLSVFCGGFDIEDVVAMTKPFGWDSHQTLMALGNLVAKSLVWVESGSKYVTYRLLAAERFFARARLQESPAQSHCARMLHARTMGKVFEQARDEWPWTKPETWRVRYLNRGEDLLQAIESASTDGSDATLILKLTDAAIKIWEEKSQIGTHRSHLQRALQFGIGLPAFFDLRSRIATAYARSLMFSGNLGAAASRAWSDAVDIAVQSNNDMNYLSALFGHCSYLLMTGQNTTISEEIFKFEAIAVSSGDEGLAVDIGRLKCSIALNEGRVLAACDGLEYLARRVRTDSLSSHVNRFRGERYVTIHADLALTKCLIDDSFEAQDIISLLESKVTEDCPPGDQVILFVLTALPIAYWHRDAAQLERMCDILAAQEVASDQAVLTRRVTQFYMEISRHLQGMTCSLDKMQDLISQAIAAGYSKRSSLYFSMIADAALDLGKTTRAATLMAHAYEQHERCREMWYLPELLRVEAKLAAASGESAKALSLLQTSRTKAIAMGLRLFERRTQLDQVSVQQSGIAAKVDSTGGSPLAILNS